MDNLCPVTSLRHELGDWSQMRLAEAVGVDQATVSKWERGVALPRRKHLARMEDLSAREGTGAFSASAMMAWWMGCRGRPSETGAADARAPADDAAR